MPAALRQRLVSVVVLAGSVGLLGLGCSRADASKASLPKGENKEATIGVRAERPTDRLEGDVAKATGQLRSKLEATLSAPVSGTISKVLVSAGARVKKDQPLVQLDASNLYIQLDQAKAARRIAAAQRQTAQNELERTQKLHEGGSAPASVLERASAGLEQADAALAQADAQIRSVMEGLRDHTLRAPFDGVITARMKNVGDFVAMMPPTALLTIVDVDHLEVRASIPEALALQLQPGQTLKGRSIPQGLPFEGAVTSIGAVVDPTSRSIEVLADVTAAGALRPGSLAEVELGAEAAQGLFVPATALATEGSQRFLWLVKDGVVSRRPVSAEQVTPRFLRVDSGLTPEDLVVVEGGSSLKEGQRVKVASARTPNAAPATGGAGDPAASAAKKSPSPSPAPAPSQAQEDR